MKKRIRWLPAVLAVLLLLLLADPAYRLNVRRLDRAAESAEGDTVSLSQLVPFRWDTAYTFSPYASRKEMASAMGVPESRRIPETVSEGMTQLIFLRDGRVVCAVCGYPDSLGWRMEFTHWDGGAACVTYRENARFSVKRDGGVVTLAQLE